MLDFCTELCYTCAEVIFMLKILMIGNSFGTDPTRYLNGVSRAEKHEVKVVNLYIGGCSLYRHYRNMLSEEPAYEFEINGQRTGLFVSLKKGLLLEEWDYVGFHQCSPKSGEYDTYQPYLDELSAYVRKLCPPAKIFLQKTWSFADDCPRFGLTPFANREEMLPALNDAYDRAIAALHPDVVIPSLDAMNELYDAIGAETYRDGFHCQLGHTRYMLACLWYMALTGRSCAGNTFRDFDVEVPEERRQLALDIAVRTAEKCGLIRK